MSATATCPNIPVCNFHRAALLSGSRVAASLLDNYCFNAAKCGGCFRSQFMRRQCVNLSAEIAPDATIIEAFAKTGIPSNMAADTVARLYAHA